MKLKTFTYLLLGLAITACEKPAEVEIRPDSDDIEVSAIANADTNYAAAQVDSGGVLPGDQLRFAGRLTIAKITYDTPTQVQSFAYSRVLFEDRRRPVQFLGRRFGFHGFNLGQVLLNNDAMVRIPHRVEVRRLFGDSLVIAGFEYVADLTTSYQSAQQYTWNVSSPDSVNPFSVGVHTPSDLTVHHPRGGAIISRNEDLRMRWTGSGNLTIIISGYEPATGRTRPFLKIHPRVNRGSAVIGSKFLRVLPQRFRYFTFTFVLANRNETVVVGQYDGSVLAQAACVYNSYVELR